MKRRILALSIGMTGILPVLFLPRAYPASYLYFFLAIMVSLLISSREI